MFIGCKDSSRRTWLIYKSGYQAETVAETKIKFSDNHFFWSAFCRYIPYLEKSWASWPELLHMFRISWLKISGKNWLKNFDFVMTRQAKMTNSENAGPLCRNFREFDRRLWGQSSSFCCRNVLQKFRLKFLKKLVSVTTTKQQLRGGQKKARKERNDVEGVRFWGKKANKCTTCWSG